jgi:dihydropteroate synthase
MGIADHLEYPHEIAHLDLEARLLGHLAPHRLGEVLTGLDVAAGHGPQTTGRLPGAPHHEQRPVAHDDGSDCNARPVRHAASLSERPLLSTAMFLSHATGRLRLDRCLVMGILNRTPDSFYDGGRMDVVEIVDLAHRMASEGADVLDIGGVKGGPGPAVDVGEELDRVVPVVDALASDVALPLAVETGRPEVARLVLEAGASIVNDVTALARPGLAEECGGAGAAMVLMHNGNQLRGRPRSPVYPDVVDAVIAEWRRLSAAAVESGMANDALVMDPGLDFGKTTGHSLELMRRLGELVAQAWPVLVAPSHKDVVGETLGLPVGDRLEGSLALVALSAAAGASFVRVHDVAPSVRVVAMVEAVMGRRAPAAPVRGLWD